MSSEIDKIGEKHHKNINNLIPENPNPENHTGGSEGLSEKEALTSGLSGENPDVKAENIESDELTSKLSGELKAQGDEADFSSSEELKSNSNQSENPSGKIIPFSDSTINYFKSKYPNIAKGYLTNGNLFLLDENNNIIKDIQGNPVQVDYTKVKNPDAIDLVSFYVEHSGEGFDISKLQYYQNLQAQYTGIELTNPEFKHLLINSEIEKLKMLSETERKNYILAKMWNASNSEEVSELNEILRVYFSYKCQNIANNAQQSDYMRLLEEHVSVSKLAEYIKKVTSNISDKIAKAELMWNILSGMGKLAELYIQSINPENFDKSDFQELYLNSQLKEAARVFFDNTDFLSVRKKQDLSIENNFSRRNKPLDVIFKGLGIKEFRAEISKLSSESDIKNVQIIINNSGFTAAEKQMLIMECTKQLGKIQNNSAKNPEVQMPEKTSVSDNDDKIYSKTSFELFKVSKNPAQREMAKIILADKRLYLAGSDRSVILKQILANCTSLDDVSIKQQLIDKILQNNKFLNKGGVLNEYIMYCIQNVNSDNFNAQIELLNLYDSLGSDLNGNVFAYIMYNLSDNTDFKTYLNSIKILLNSKKLDMDYINNHATKDFLDDIVKICKEAKNGLIKGISIEDVISNYNIRTVVMANLLNNSYTPQLEDLRAKLLSNSRFNQFSRYQINDENYSIDYPSYVKEVLERLSVLSSKDTQFDKIFEFASNILTDDTLGKNIGALKMLAEILSTETYEPERLGYVYSALQTGIKKNYNSEELYGIAKQAYEADIKMYIADFVKNGNNYNSNSDDTLKEVFYPIIRENEDIYKNFIRGRAYTGENLYDLHKYADKEYGKDILSDLCERQEFSAEGILSVMKHTTESTVKMVKKVLLKNNISAQEKVNIVTAIDLNRNSLDIIELILEHDDLNLNTLPNILKSITVLDSYNVNNENKKIDPKKLGKYMQLLQNPKTSPWAIKMLNEGWDIDVIASLTPTKMNFYANEITNDKEYITNPDEKFFTDYGLNSQEAEALVKAISKNGMINPEMQKAAIDLIESGISGGQAAEILNSATITGDYNSKITADFLSLKNLGLNAFTERYLPVINNLSSAEIAVKYNSDIIKNLKSMILNIPSDAKPALRAKGFNIEGISKKLNSKVVMSNEKISNAGKARVVNSQWRTRASVSGFEKILIDKYEPKEAIWRSEQSTRDWAENKYQTIKNRQYLSDVSSDDAEGKKVSELRQKYLASWFEYLDSIPELSKNPCVKVIIADYITKDLRVDNFELPPKFDSELAKKVLSDALKGNKLNSGKTHKPAKNKFASTETAQINSRKMIWHTFNRTDGSYSRKYKSFVDNITSLTSGTIMSKQLEHLNTYLEQGNLHFLVDEFGLTQLCVLTNQKGEVEEILSRNGNSDGIPAYIDFIQDFVSKNNLSCNNNLLNTSSDTKDKFDKTKSELHALAEKNNYAEILRRMGIDTTQMPDGTLELSHYAPYVNQFALSDFGINEDDLLSNVSNIKGDVNLEDSNATSMPKLKNVSGNFISGGTELRNLNELERIKNKKIHW